MELDVGTKLDFYTLAADQVKESFPSSPTFLLVLDAKNKNLTVQGFAKGAKGQEEAQHQYEAAEAANAAKPRVDAVLVAADSIEGLKRAYPNYFADTRGFRAIVESTIA